jgi:esterase/lipase
LLHGFQQTHRSEPINSLASNLAAKGYTVLNPTMSLGVNHRSQSMPCEAVHTQTIEEEVAEIGYWKNWLNDKGMNNIVLASFSSTGNLAMLLYTSQAPRLSIQKAILIAPNPPVVDPKQKRKIIASIKSRAQKDEQNLGIFTMSYCKNNYATTTDSYLSYAKYDSKEFIELIKNSQVQTELILGSADTVITPSWATQLKALNSPVRITTVNKAGHFFDGPSEFDLADAVENLLKN